jgi:hypothetical protein
MTTTDHESKAIARYLWKRHGFLKDCKAHVENQISDEKRTLMRTCEDQEVLGKYFFHLDYVVRNTFRYCMLTAYCSFLEEAVKMLCERSVEDYDTKFNAIRRGNWLSKHRQVLGRHPSVDLAAIEDELDTMEDFFVVVRNCIVHAWGRLEKCRNKAQLHKIVERRGGLFGTSGDEFLVVEGDAVSTASVTSRTIVNKLLEDLLGLPPCSI